MLRTWQFNSLWQFISARFHLLKDYSKLKGKKAKIVYYASICSIIAIPLAILIFAVQTKVGPTRRQVDDIKEGQKQIPKQIHDAVSEALREELAINKIQLVTEKGLPAIQPSEEAKKIAEKIPDNAGPYALAMKAVAESQFDKARELSEKAAKEKEVELAEIYRLRGEIEIYAGNYKAAAEWYKEALKLAGSDEKILREAATAFYYNAEYKKAEPLLKHALEIDEAAFGKDHPKVATRLNNLAQLYQATNRLKEAEPLMVRALQIDEKAFGKDHPNIAIDLNNLAQLYQATNRLKEAEPLMKRALEIDEKAFGKDHPKVAIRLNNLAVLLKVTNRSAEAQPLLERALAILEKSLGPEHPSTITVRRNLEGI